MSDKEENIDISEFTAGDSFFGQMKKAGIADDTFIREIVEMFLDESVASLRLISKAFEDNDQQAIRLYAHKLKSSFLMFDMHQAHDFAVDLEHIKVPLNLGINTFTELQDICKKSFKLLKLKYLS
jgi:HPt (histidine-containing phosphotransfer) domain-containing protein